MRTPVVQHLLGLATLVAVACGSPSGDFVAQGAEAVSAGQTFNFGALAHPESCMDARASGTENGTQLQEWACNGTGAQSFTLEDAGGGDYAIVNTHASKCVDVQARGTANGTKIQLYDCNQTPAQIFRVADAGGGFVSFVNAASGKCLDVAADSPADGTVVQLYDCNGTNAQRWNPTVIGGGSTTPTPQPPPPTGSHGGAHAITFLNQCSYPVWVGGEGNPISPATPCSAGCPANSVCNTANQLCTWSVPSAPTWELTHGQSTAVALPPSWGGRFWPRTECSNVGGRTVCATGDCAGNLECPVGVGGAPPATLAEFTVVPPSGGSDFYDVSNVDGSNVPVAIAPTAGTFDPTPPAGADVPYYCASPGCTHGCGALPACSWGLESSCPTELQDRDPGHVVGCRSAGQICAVNPSNPTLHCASEDDLYGCTGGGPNGVSGSCYSAGASSTCCGCPSWSPAGACRSSNPRWTPPSLPGKYAQVFKDACPTAYSFPYDDLTSTFTCRGSSSSSTGYTITFCP